MEWRKLLYLWSFGLKEHNYERNLKFQNLELYFFGRIETYTPGLNDYKQRTNDRVFGVRLVKQYALLVSHNDWLCFQKYNSFAFPLN